MKKENIISVAVILTYIIISVSIFLFIFSFLLGSLTAGFDKISTCNEVNYNIEKLPPVKMGCWFWQEV